MHLFSWVDNRTLIVCQCIMAAVFSLVLFCIWRLYPQLRGVGSMAIGFSLGIPTAALFAARGHIPNFLSIVVANFFIFLLYVFLYRGVLLFCQSRGYMPALLTLAGVSLVVLTYYSEVQHNIIPRIFVISLTVGVARALMAYEIYKRSAGQMHMILFSITLGLFSASTLIKALLVPLQGSPDSFLTNDPIQSTQLLSGILFVCVDGMFYLTMLIREVTSTIEHQAQLDFLTGTLNRRGIEEALIVEIARTRRSQRPIAVLLIDIDHFKSINDIQGHAAGDEALRLVSRSIASVLRIYDTLGRFGGDEFLLVLPETTGEPAMMIAERIREALISMSATARIPPMTLSIGVTFFERNEEPIDIIGRADAALYEAKRAGRNCSRLQPPPDLGNPGPHPHVALPRATLLSRVTSRRRTRNTTL
ncbi:diguanylate cyclase (GGDEF) domain-containing protein [Granulicella pectinivorans]|uniref:diguanylate cyclase n=1 Tax=Granulicella pectinivorans TaxID=474950 RepID=A0A1I6MNI6_9BACT|nr:GGDEF domain-containing protein [Granulicella pectinivorans]SFS17249.1 diguanylate cyclase (GGDEF) domain-containing protein [Granulicella pectinivorans]